MTSRLILLILILMSYESNATPYEDYQSEKIEYIMSQGRLLPEITKFKCRQGVLYKARIPQRMYTGKPIKCKILKLTRSAYDETIINTLF